MKVLALFLILCVAGGFCDLYMQYMRGSNDRLRENNANRNNANRLFDSQNNAKGGYCKGPEMYFYEGSLLALEWTNQHGCGNPRMYCNLVIQYMCGTTDKDNAEKYIRDGSETTRIDTNLASVQQKTGTEYTFGQHESLAYYQACNTRERNFGLFIADRQQEGNLNQGRRTAIFTRQNNNGNRHGFECTEERDYYPYWHPSPWVDVAVLASSTKDCDFYKKESQNVKSRNECRTKAGAAAKENQKASCQAAGNDWVEVSSHKKSSPDCIKAPWSRENHLGNAATTTAGHTAGYNWTIPAVPEDANRCVLRMRYNISTTDVDNSPEGNFIDSKKNAANSPVEQDEIVSQDGAPMQLAIDTSQFGRTFQDRSHVFLVKKRPDSIASQARIFNLNVRGKRGNIVETYPATEYDFVPTHLEIYKNDYIHFQWVGCDQNPQGNAGEGTAGTDRSNIVQIVNPSQSKPASDGWLRSNTPLFPASKTRKKMAMLGQPVDDPTKCKSYAQLLSENNNNQNQAEQDTENCMLLNAAGEYFDGGLVKMEDSGTFYYMSTRNHNFSNRDQKGTIVVSNFLPTWAIVIVVLGAVLFLGAAATAAAIFYGKTHPHSAINTYLSKL